MSQRELNMPTKYDPQTTEHKWYSHWLEGGFFKATATPKRKRTRS